MQIVYDQRLYYKYMYIPLSMPETLSLWLILKWACEKNKKWCIWIILSPTKTKEVGEAHSGWQALVTMGALAQKAEAFW